MAKDKKSNGKIFVIVTMAGCLLASTAGFFMFYNSSNPTVEIKEGAKKEVIKEEKITTSKPLEELSTLEELQKFVDESEEYDELDDILTSEGKVATILTKYKDYVAEEGVPLPDDYTIPVNGVKSDIPNYEVSKGVSKNFIYRHENGEYEELPLDPRDDVHYKNNWDADLEMLGYITEDPNDIFITDEIMYFNVDSYDAYEKYEFMKKYLSRIEAATNGKYEYELIFYGVDAPYPDDYEPHEQFELFSLIWRTVK